MSESEVSSFTSRHSCECYKKLQTYGIPLHISDENEFLSEYPTMLMYENAFPLPGYIKINEDITEYPIIEDNELPHVFQQMAQVIPSLSDFEENVLSFYILDIIIEGLWTAQNEKMNFNHQKVTLLWILYFFNYIQKHNPTRKDLFDHLKIVLFCSKKIKDSEDGEGELSTTSKSDDLKTAHSNPPNLDPKAWDLPLPPDYNKYYKGKLSSSLSARSEEISSLENGKETERKSSVTVVSELKNQIPDTETNIHNLKIILEILYRIFARAWVYQEIQTVFHSMPPSEQVDLPFTLNPPKPLFKPEPPPVKGDKNGKRQSLLDKSSEILQSSKNDYILPLQMAEEAVLYMKQVLVPQSSLRSALGKIKEEKTKK